MIQLYWKVIWNMEEVRINQVEVGHHRMLAWFSPAASPRLTSKDGGTLPIDTDNMFPFEGEDDDQEENSLQSEMCSLGLGSFGGQYPLGVTPDTISLAEMIRLSNTCLETSITCVYQYILTVLAARNSLQQKMLTLQQQQMMNPNIMRGSASTTWSAFGRFTDDKTNFSNRLLQLNNKLSSSVDGVLISLLNMLHEFRQPPSNGIQNNSITEETK